jgi:hypothetical protein
MTPAEIAKKLTPAQVILALLALIAVRAVLAEIEKEAAP